MRTKRTPKVKNVLIVLWLAGSAGRKQLSGILRYVSENHPWNIRIVSDPRDFTRKIVEHGNAMSLDGFLGHASSEAAFLFTSRTVPSVLLDYPPPSLGTRGRNYLLMLDADEDIGRQGAEYFLSLGRFASFGFVPDTERRGWSRLRERGFRKALAERGETAQSFDPHREPLEQWIASLPKPAAIMASHDFRAKDVIDACRAAQVNLPDGVSVLGVDNDEIVCDYSNPQISSIRIDHEQFGYRAARELDVRMRRKSNPKAVQKILIPATNIVERGSTRHTSPMALLVARITRCIEEHATEPVSARDIVAKTGVSRSLADLRFRQATGKSIRRALEDRRLELVRHRLKTSDASIERISRLCGFQNPQRLKYVFKARFGMSMTEYRQS